jgi:hypothetical protein
MIHYGVFTGGLSYDGLSPVGLSISGVFSCGLSLYGGKKISGLGMGAMWKDLERKKISQLGFFTGVCRRYVKKYGRTRK